MTRLVCPNCFELVLREACVLVSEPLFAELLEPLLICPACGKSFESFEEGELEHVD